MPRSVSCGFPPSPDEVSNDRASSLRIVVTSDTHERHWKLKSDLLPNGDVFVHCGDIFFKSRKFTEKQFLEKIEDFNEWLGTLRPRFRYGAIVIAGNHDAWLERYGFEKVQSLLSNAVYLQNTHIDIAGVRFFGCPLSQGDSMNRAFQDVAYTWHTVIPPRNVDVLITHQPCSRQDISTFIANTGCCRLHLAGHDHEAYGVYEIPWNQSAALLRQKLRYQDACDRLSTKLDSYELPAKPVVVHESIPGFKPRTFSTNKAATITAIASLVNDNYSACYAPFVFDLPFEIGQGHPTTEAQRY